MSKIRGITIEIGADQVKEKIRQEAIKILTKHITVSSCVKENKGYTVKIGLDSEKALKEIEEMIIEYENTFKEESAPKDN